MDVGIARGEGDVVVGVSTGTDIFMKLHALEVFTEKEVEGPRIPVTRHLQATYDVDRHLGGRP